MTPFFDLSGLTITVGRCLQPFRPSEQQARDIFACHHYTEQLLHEMMRVMNPYFQIFG